MPGTFPILVALCSTITRPGRGSTWLLSMPVASSIAAASRDGYAALFQGLGSCGALHGGDVGTKAVHVLGQVRSIRLLLSCADLPDLERCPEARKGFSWLGEKS